MTTYAGNVAPTDKIATAPRYAIELDATIVASFSECAGLTATMRNDKWEEGGANYTTLKFPGRVDYSNLTLKHGVTYSADLFDWFLKVMQGQKLRKPITVKLVTQNLEEIRSWHFIEAFPVTWTGPTLQSTSNTIAIETIEFAHHGLIKA